MRCSFIYKTYVDVYLWPVLESSLRRHDICFLFHGEITQLPLEDPDHQSLDLPDCKVFKMSIPAHRESLRCNDLFQVLAEGWRQ